MMSNVRRSTPLLHAGLPTLLFLLAGCATETPERAAEQPVPDAAHTSQNALDWAGTYTGTVPCLECPGIHTRVSLYPDGSFSRVSEYVDREEWSDVDRGLFTWSGDGRTVQLDGLEGGPVVYQVVENAVVQMDTDGNPFVGDQASKYRLTKLHEPTTVEDTRWRMIELRGASVAATDQTAWFILESFNGRAHGSLGCNGFGASYTIPDSTRIRFEEIESTEMACVDPPQDDALGSVLQMVDTWNLSSDTLSLTTARMAWQARFVAE